MKTGTPGRTALEGGTAAGRRGGGAGWLGDMVYVDFEGRAVGYTEVEEDRKVDHAGACLSSWVLLMERERVAL